MAETSEGRLTPENIVGLYHVVFLQELAKQYAGDIQEVFGLETRSAYVTDVYLTVDPTKMEIDLPRLRQATYDASIRMAEMSVQASKGNASELQQELGFLQNLPFKKFWMNSLPETLLTRPETLTSLAFLIKSFENSRSMLETFYRQSYGFSTNRILSIAKTMARYNLAREKQGLPLFFEDFDHYHQLLNVVASQKAELQVSYPSLVRDKQVVFDLFKNLKDFNPEKPEDMVQSLREFLLLNSNLKRLVENRTRSSSEVNQESEKLAVKLSRFLYLFRRLKVLPDEAKWDTELSRREFSETAKKANVFLHLDLKNLGVRGLVELYYKTDQLKLAADELTNYAKSDESKISKSTLESYFKKLMVLQSQTVAETAGYLEESIKHLASVLEERVGKRFSIWAAGDDVYVAVEGEPIDAKELGQILASNSEIQSAFRVLVSTVTPDSSHNLNFARSLFHEGVRMIKYREYLHAAPSFIYVDGKKDNLVTINIDVQQPLLEPLSP